MTYRKKLIEVALPLDAINRESAREKSIRHGHPSTLHLWWARRPLATCRAVLFASLVDDPGNDLPEEEAAKERERLFRIIEELVKWENTNNEVVLQAARDEILKSTKGNPPPVLDPFCGGGSIPLEAQRLGLEAYASDLNPVAVLITKALVEIPPKFAGKPPVNPDANKGTGSTAAWKGASGLAADVRYYGKWMRDEAWKRIGHLYPKGPKGETIIAWLWARTVKCPNPVCGAQMPLVRSFWLSTKSGKEVWLQPIVNSQTNTVHFQVRSDKSVGSLATRVGMGTKLARGAKFECVVCKQPVEETHIKHESMQGRMGQQLVAMVAEGNRLRTFLPAEEQHIRVACSAKPKSIPTEPMDRNSYNLVSGRGYGFFQWGDLFTSRQLIALNTLCDLVHEARNKVLDSSENDTAYADAVTTYLGVALSRIANTINSFAIWSQSRTQSINVFSRQALPMVWDFVEVNPFAGAAGDYYEATKSIGEILIKTSGISQAHVFQLDASAVLPPVEHPIVFTDPPYYDNIGYADISDFFYVWLRRGLGRVYPDLFSTILTPKTQELVATPARFGGDKNEAIKHFEDGLSKAFKLIRQQSNPDLPIIIYYAFKQEEEETNNGSTGSLRVRASTGWETMLNGLLNAGFKVTGTWPMRTERPTGMKAETNALASSIVLACRQRPEDAPMATRREFLATLRKELPQELKVLMNGRVAPVDLAQATIGPGMAVFSRYSKVLEADGSAMTVRTALQEINYFLEDFLAQQEGDLDVESQFCIAWFQQYGSREGSYGEADVLARAKNISVEGLTRMGLVDAPRGKVRLTLREDYADGWDPQTQSRLTAWEACQRLVWALNENGEQDAGRLARRLGGLADQARELAYRLYSIADRKGWTEEALGYNALVASWPEIQEAAAQAAEETQGRMV